MSDYQDYILKIIDGGIEKNDSKVKSYSRKLCDLMKDEDEKFSKRISNLLEKKSVHPNYLDSFLIKPRDKEHNDTASIVFVNKDIDIIANSEVLDKKKYFVDIVKNKDTLSKFGIINNSSMLIYGPPGTGKTTMASIISKEIDLPLVIGKLDNLISSFLGETSKNVSRLFEYAGDNPCILFLDELDAIAKKRDDNNEIGELKRIVNSILQNIDEFLSKGGILIAATNHQELLDDAIWRRFTLRINMEKPKNDVETKSAIKFFLNNMNGLILPENLVNILTTKLRDKSQATIQHELNEMVTKVILDAKIEDSSKIINNDLIIHKLDSLMPKNIG